MWGRVKKYEEETMRRKERVEYGSCEGGIVNGEGD
jgi:hypothetical protein